MSDNIPFHIQAEIIIKLPIKSLIQFRLVSKTWKSLIDSSRFITDYHQQTHLQQHLLVGDAFRYNYVSFVDNDTFPRQKVSLTLPKSVLNLKKPLIVGSSQGLFCFYNFFQAAIIWNPTIRKSVDVVVPKPSDGRSYSTVVGFGVCPCTLDPMLVKIYTESGCPHETKINTTWLVEVFRLSSGDWKSLSVGLPRRNIAVSGNQVVVDRFIYWSSFDMISGCHLILSFDMIREEFSEIRLPDSLLRANVDTAMGLSIRNLEESVVMLQFACEMAFRHEFVVWMMGNGDPKSFENVYTIKGNNILDAPIIDVLAFRKNGEPIVAMRKLGVETYDYQLFVYERNSRHVKHIGISAKQYSFFVSSYKETLLLLDH